MKTGCTTSDRNVGPWTLCNDNAWKAPVWVRKGPSGYRSMFGDDAAFIGYAGFTVYGPDGLLEESGHFPDASDEVIEREKIRVDATLRDFGWIVDGTAKSLRPKSWWKKVICGR